jgi:hypothetical protein
MAVLAITFAWPHITGEWRNEKKPITIKKHGRKRISFFRYGLDFIAHSLSDLKQWKKRLKGAINLLKNKLKGLSIKGFG